ncbi:unnamed protein product, partial [Symbiodinium sp. CCMP2456]
MLVIDEGSRFRVARVLTKGSKQQPSANACLSYLQEGWHQYFGHPRALRVDPAGSFRSFALIDQYCDKHGVFLDVIPGEAHWKNGVCEQAIQGVKELMTRLCSYDSELTSEGALAEAVTVFNHRDMVRGFSPAQHVIGRGADDTHRFVEAGQGLPPGLLVENPEGEFARATQRRAEAEKIHADWNVKDDDSLAHGKGVFWARRGYSRATEREEILEGISAQAGQPTPWTFTQMAESLGGNQFQDATQDVPDLQEWHRAQEATEAPQPSRLRFRQKRPAPGPATRDVEGDAEMEPASEEPSPVPQRPRLEPQSHESGLSGECWWSTVPEQAWPETPTNYWDDDMAAVEVEVGMPESQRGVLRMARNFEGYFVGQMKRKAVEVSERRLPPAEQAEFRGAKQVEVGAYVEVERRRDPEGKGDVSGAFLQAREYPDTLYCIPTPEICEAMNIPENSVTQIKRACYGLVDAPLEWYRTVDAFLQSIGMERCSSDACMWCYRDQGELKGLISGHVDDFIFGGDDSHEGWCDKLKQIREHFRWGDWETDKFTQCGVLIETTPQGFSLSQPSYLEGISEIGVNATRRKDKQVSHSTVDTIIRANILLQHANEDE